MITINSFEYYGPYIIEPLIRFFEGMLRCDTPKGEKISKNLIITENSRFDPRPFPLLKQERLQLAEGYFNSLENSSSSTYYMVDAFVAAGHEKEVTKMMETHCHQSVLCLLLLTEEARIAMQQIGQLDTVFCVAHLNELDGDNNLLPVHMHIVFRTKEASSEKTKNAIRELTAAEPKK